MAGPLIPLLASIFRGAVGAVMTRAAATSAAGSARAAVMSGAEAFKLLRTPQATVNSASMPGLSPSQLMSMMGQSNSQIQQSQNAARQQQAQAQNARTQQQHDEQFVKALKTAAVATGQFHIALTAIPISLKEFSSAILESRESLRNFNGGINAAFARLEAQNMHLGIRTANATEGSTVGMADAMRDFNEAFQPIREGMATGLNLIGTFALRAGASFATALQYLSLLGPILAILKYFESRPEKGSAILPEHEMLFRMASGDFTGHHHMRPIGNRTNRPDYDRGSGY